MNRIYLEVHTSEHLRSLRQQGVQSQARKAGQANVSGSSSKSKAESSSIQRVLASLRLVLAR